MSNSEIVAIIEEIETLRDRQEKIRYENRMQNTPLAITEYTAAKAASDAYGQAIRIVKQKMNGKE